MHTIRPLETADWEGWSALWGGYLDFYRAELSEETSRATFERLCAGTDGLFGLLALDEGGAAVGLANCVVHATTWSRQPKCYLEDLFVSPAARGARPGPGPAQGREAGGHRAGGARGLLAHPAVQRPGPLPLRRGGPPHLLRRLRDVGRPVARPEATPERSLSQRTFTVFLHREQWQESSPTPTVRPPLAWSPGPGGSAGSVSPEPMAPAVATRPPPRTSASAGANHTSPTRSTPASKHRS